MSQIVSDWFFFSWENNFHISPRAGTEVALITNPQGGAGTTPFVTMYVTGARADVQRVRDACADELWWDARWPRGDEHVD